MLIRSIIRLSLLVLLAFVPVMMSAQNSNKLDKVGEYVDVELNLSNNHLWRGFEVSDGIVMASTLAVHDKNNIVRAALWNGTNADGSYKEFNFIAELKIGGWKLAYLDAMNYSPKNAADYNVDDFFDYKARTTGRFLDLALSYDFGQKFPLTLTWATIFYGRDRYAANTQTGEASKNRYSSFCSAEYVLYKDNLWKFDASVGGTFCLNRRKSDKSTFYSDKPGIVQVELQATRNVEIAKNYTIPVHAKGMWNPVMKRAFFQIGATVFSF